MKLPRPLKFLRRKETASGLGSDEAAPQEGVFTEIGIIMNCQATGCTNNRSIPARYITSMLVDNESAYLEAKTEQVGSCGSGTCETGNYARVLREAANITCAAAMVRPEVVAVVDEEVFAQPQAQNSLASK